MTKSAIAQCCTKSKIIKVPARLCPTRGDYNVLGGHYSGLTPHSPQRKQRGRCPVSYLNGGQVRRCNKSKPPSPSPFQVPLAHLDSLTPSDGPCLWSEAGPRRGTSRSTTTLPTGGVSQRNGPHGPRRSSHYRSWSADAVPPEGDNAQKPGLPPPDFAWVEGALPRPRRVSGAPPLFVFKKKGGAEGPLVLEDFLGALVVHFRCAPDKHRWFFPAGSRVGRPLAHTPQSHSEMR